MRVYFAYIRYTPLNNADPKLSMAEKEKIAARIAELMFVDTKKMYQSDSRAKRQSSDVRKFNNVNCIIILYWIYGWEIYCLIRTIRSQS